MLTTKEAQDLRERFVEERGFDMGPNEAYAFFTASQLITLDVPLEDSHE